jgi:hypothetical protein
MKLLYHLHLLSCIDTLFETKGRKNVLTFSGGHTMLNVENPVNG